VDLVHAAERTIRRHAATTLRDVQAKLAERMQRLLQGNEIDLARVALQKKDLATARARSRDYAAAVFARNVPLEVRQSHELAGMIAVQAEEWATAIGLGGIVPPNGEWPGIAQEVQRLKFLFFGLILVLTMLLRPQGLIPSRVRQQELTKGVHEDQTIEDVNAETTA